MIRKIILVLIGCFLLTFSFGDDFNVDHILILNSYSESYNWTNAVMDGLLDHLDDRHQIHVEYMDTKNYSSEDYFEIYYNFLQYKYKDIRFDMIITTDDYALQFVLKHREVLFKDTPIFFTGVNSIEDYPLDDLNQIYGLEEKVSASDTLEVIKDLKPTLSRIHLVVDDTISGQLTKKEIYDQIGHEVEIRDYSSYSFYEIIDQLSDLEGGDEAILLAYYIVDKDGTFINTDIMTKRIAAVAKIPMFGLYHFSFDHGIVGGKLVSGYEQGKHITEMIQSYKQNAYGNTHYESNEANLHYYDYQYLEKFNMDVRRLPSGATIINRPESFLDRHKEIIIASLLIIMLLIVYILTLRQQVKRQTKRQLFLNQQLAEADKLASLGDMMKRISHELNTPIGNSITTSSFILKSIQELDKKYREDKLSKSALEKHISGVLSTSEVLEQSLINANELLNAFRIFSDHSEEDFHKFDLEYYLKNLIKTYQPILKVNDHTIILDISSHLIIKGNTRDYYKLFNHLIRNAIDHGFKNMKSKSIFIQIVKEKQHLNILFKDNGQGISEKHLEHIFEPLYRLDHNDHVVMGLSTVYKIVTNLKGHIHCESKVGIGTTFQILIPLKKEL